jgi:peptidyl-prolyl cis-trans isomerase C
MQLRRIAAPVAALSLCSLAACATMTQQELPQPQPVAAAAAPRPIERVNGAVINARELERTARAILARNHMTQPSPELLKQAEAIALNELTSEALLYQEAAKEKMEGVDKLVSEKLAKEKGAFPSAADYEKSLAEKMLTADEMRELTRREIVINHFIEGRIASKVAVSDQETRKFYDDNLDRYFKKGERVKASHILVAADEKASAEERKKAREKAAALLARVRAGEEFAGLARKESNCPSATKGGELEIFGKGQMVPPFEQAAFALNPGEVSPVVETRFGYHIIKLAEKYPASVQQFEEVKEKIAAYLKGYKIRQALAAFVEELRAKAKIEKV